MIKIKIKNIAKAFLNNRLYEVLYQGCVKSSLINIKMLLRSIF